jgi:hypothetical protein
VRAAVLGGGAAMTGRAMWLSTLSKGFLQSF